jgi:signal transduction histidine kinase
MDEEHSHSIFINEENTRLVGILSIIILASWGVYLFVIITAIYYKDWSTLITTAVGCALLFVPFLLLGHQKLRASSLLVVLFEIFTITIIATLGQGIRDLAIVAFPIIIIFAGLVLDRELFRLCVGLLLVAVCWLVFGEEFGWFVTKPLMGEMTNWFYLFGVTFILLLATLAVDLLASNIRRNMERAKSEIAQREHAEEEIRKLNAILEQRVADRTKELKNAQEQLVRNAKLAVLGQMAGSVGHELRNPLGVINASIYYLKLVQPEANEKIKDHFNMIEQEV